MCHIRVLFTNIFRRSNLLPVIEEDSSDNYLCLLLIKIGSPGSSSHSPLDSGII